MPIYDFSCRACGNQFELLVRKNEPACPKCSGKDLEKLISLPAIKSETTHALAMKAAKRRDSVQGGNRQREQREYELKHDD
jgi:putative FmdB family regulatory protein